MFFNKFLLISKLDFMLSYKTGAKVQFFHKENNIKIENPGANAFEN
ncbi:hypothetical protein AGMMS50239_38740 [Bacteroidia bacterium]|nr:hypothetical protein AGMMS50239_38740 [Bacteroidia bacterium]